MDDFSTNDRIIEVRKATKKSQAAFGQCLGVSRDVIKNIEYKNTVPSALIIKMICSEFAISREWLETGEGDMYDVIPSKNFEFDAYHLEISNLSDESFKKKFYNALMKLTDEQWGFLENIVALLTEAENAKKEEGEP